MHSWSLTACSFHANSPGFPGGLFKNVLSAYSQKTYTCSDAPGDALPPPSSSDCPSPQRCHPSPQGSPVLIIWHPMCRLWNAHTNESNVGPLLSLVHVILSNQQIHSTISLFKPPHTLWDALCFTVTCSKLRLVDGCVMSSGKVLAYTAGRGVPRHVETGGGHVPNKQGKKPVGGREGIYELR